MAWEVRRQAGSAGVSSARGTKQGDRLAVTLRIALGKPEVLQRAVHQRAVFARTHVREVSSRIAVGWWALLYVRPPAPHVRSRLVIPGGRLVFVFGVQIQMVG